MNGLITRNTAATTTAAIVTRTADTTSITARTTPRSRGWVISRPFILTTVPTTGQLPVVSAAAGFTLAAGSAAGPAPLRNAAWCLAIASSNSSPSSSGAM